MAALKKIAALCFVLLTCVMQLGVESSYRQKVKVAEKHRKQLQQQLQSSLDEMVRFSTQELSRIHDRILSSDRSKHTIASLLREQLNKGRGLVRFAWVDKKDRMSISSVIGMINPTSDLSNRDYLRQTRAKPNHVITSKMLTHIVNQRQVIIMAIGVADASAYIGTLNAAHNMPPLREHIHAIMQSCECRYAVYSPYGEWITGDDNDLRLPRESSHGFGVVSAISPATQAMLQHERFYLRIIALGIATALALGLWLVLRIWYRRDAQLALKLQAQLNHAKKLHESWLHSTTGELHEAANSIMVYGQTLQAQVEEGTAQDDMPYWYDDVQEMGRNLHILTQSMDMLGEATPDDTKLPIQTMIATSLESFEDGIERRNMVVHWHEADHEIELSAPIWGILLKLCWGWMIRHAQDESYINMQCERGDGHIKLTAHLSKLRQSLLPVHQQSFGGLISAYQFDMAPAWDEKLRKHVNFLIMKQLTRAHNIRMHMEVGTDQSVCIRFSIRMD